MNAVMKNTISIDPQFTTVTESDRSRKKHPSRKKLSLFFEYFATSTADEVREAINASLEVGEVLVYIAHPQTGELIEVDPEQLWFWTPEWQTKEREVDEELARGDYEVFDSIDDFINSL